MRLDHLSTKDATTIQESLQKYKVTQWGFVLFRCTYGSQEKWDKFVALLKEHAHDYFEWRDMEHVYDSLAWTIIQDADTLDGAGIVETSRRFREWIEGPGRQEMQESVFAGEEWPYWPRYRYFLHVDEESLESVVDDKKAREPAGYFCKLVREDTVALNLAAEDEREEDVKEDEDEDEDEDELLDMRKRVKLDELVPCYTTLLDIDRWYNVWVEDGIAQLP
jgi:hypothetical protein